MNLFLQRLRLLVSPTGGLLLLWFLSTQILDQSLQNQLHQQMMSHDGPGLGVWIFGLSSFALGLIGPLGVLLLTLAAWTSQGQPLKTYLAHKVSFLVKEQLRAYGTTLMWSFLLIIPGLIRFFQMSFVGMVVLLDPQYEKGQVDALSGSQNRVRKVWGRLVLTFLVFGLIIPFVLTGLDAYQSIDETPAPALLIMLLQFLITLIFQQILLQLWEKTNEPHVSMV